MIKKLFLVPALVFIAGYSNYANSKDIYLFCDTCTSDSDFLTVVDKKTFPSGSHDVLVFNVEASTVKAYAVEFVDSDGSNVNAEKTIVSKEIPDEGYRALQLYDKLMEETDNTSQ